MDILSARLAELILQLHSLRDQIRSIVFQTLRETVVRIAGDAVDKLWRARRRGSHQASAYDDPNDRWRREEFEDDERSWTPRREPKPDSAKRNETLGRVLRAGMGWWLLRRHSLLTILGIGSAGLAVAVILGPERITPARILELIIPAIEIVSSQ